MDNQIADIAALVGDPTRTRILLALMPGSALPAGELAALSGVTPQTASAHLGKLVSSRLLKVEAQGKHRYYRLAGPKIATLMECLSTIAPPPEGLAKVESPEMRALRYARTCYSHLAGQVAVELNAAAQRQGLWMPSRDKRYRVTRRGVEWLRGLGIELPEGAWRNGSARACLDWTERRHHLAGTLGSLMMRRFFELGWAVRSRDSRALRVTGRGAAELNARLGLQLRLP